MGAVLIIMNCSVFSKDFIRALKINFIPIKETKPPRRKVFLGVKEIPLKRNNNIRTRSQKNR